MFDSMFYSFVQIVEEVIKLMINFSHQCLTFMGINIVIKIDITMITSIGFWMVIAGVRDPEVTFVGVLRHGQVSFMFPVRMCVLHPIVRSVLDAMHVVVLVNMLRVVLAIVAIGVIVTHMMSSLRFNIVIFAMLFSREVAIVVKMRFVILQVPVALLEVGIRVMLITVHQLLHKRLIVPGSELKRCLFVVPVASGKVCGSIRLLLLLLWCRL